MSKVQGQIPTWGHDKAFNGDGYLISNIKYSYFDQNDIKIKVKTQNKLQQQYFSFLYRNYWEYSLFKSLLIMKESFLSKFISI